MFGIPITDWRMMLAGALCAFLLSYFMTPPVRRFAVYIGAMDVPRDERRVHDHPIPRMGGLAIFVSFLVTALLFADMDNQVMGLLLGSVIIAVMGAMDDVLNLSPWLKLAGQVLAAVVAYSCGIYFNVLSFTGELGWLSCPLTILWIVACTNATNLIDGLDGLAAGVSAISSFFLMLVSLFAYVGGNVSVPMLLACLTGACMGFLPYNLNPAKIFMGDAGSQFLGYVLSVVSIMGLFKTQALVGFLLPLLVLAVPLGDTFAAFFRRLIHGQSPFHADRGHIHHRLLDSGLSQKQAVAVLYGLSSALGIIALWIARPSLWFVCLLGELLLIGLILFVVSRGRKGREWLKERKERKKRESDSSDGGKP